MDSSNSFNYNHSWWRSAGGAELKESKVDPDKFNLLSFLATAQNLQIEFLAMISEAGRGIVGTGGTSRIQQALINANESFAFKYYRKESRTEEGVFQTLINEITILSQPFVREHSSIAQLQGICWEISPVDNKPWPVLVFEKSHYGDLLQFIPHKGKGLRFEERLELCLDIGKAVHDMHVNGR